MPYYRITLQYDDGSALRSIRQHNSWDIEFVNRFFQEKMKQLYRGKGIKSMEVVMVSKGSDEVKDYIKSQGQIKVQR